MRYDRSVSYSSERRQLVSREAMTRTFILNRCLIVGWYSCALPGVAMAVRLLRQQ